MAAAGLRRRAAARAIDAVVTVVLAFVVMMAAGVLALVVSLSVDGWSGDRDTFWLVLFIGLALIPVAVSEVTAIARRGQTLGKKTMGLRVVVWDEGAGAPVDGSGGVGAGRSIERWAVPHGAGLLAGVVAGAASAPMIGGYGLLVGADTWLVVSAVIYLSALGDPHRRGWHDKTAGTAVVEAAPAQPAPQRGDPADETPHREPRSPTAARRGFMSVMMCAAVAGGALVGGAVFGAIEAVKSISGSEIDKYDEATRQRHDFGQRVGPDGDACWPRTWGARNLGGPVFCDLESIGGLHWDTGDLKVLSPSDIHFFVGSGYMCLLDPRRQASVLGVEPRRASPPRTRSTRRGLPQAAPLDRDRATGSSCGQTLGLRKQSDLLDRRRGPADLPAGQPLVPC